MMVTARNTDTRHSSRSPTLPDSRAESLAKPTRSRIEVPYMRRSIRVLIATHFALAVAAPAAAHIGTQPCETGREYG